MSVDVSPYHYTNMNNIFSQLKFAKNFVRPSEGMTEGGCGGNSVMPERIELSPRHLPEYLEGRTPKKNVLSFLALQEILWVAHGHILSLPQWKRMAIR